MVLCLLIVVVSAAAYVKYGAPLVKQRPSALTILGRIEKTLHDISDKLDSKQKTMPVKGTEASSKPTSPQSPMPSNDHARLQISEIHVLGQDDTPPSFTFQFFYANYGKLPSIGMVHRVALMIVQSELTDKEVQDAQSSLVATLGSEPLFNIPPVEFYPNDPLKHLFTISPAENPVGGKRLTAEEYAAVKSKQCPLYFFVVLKYRDRSMPTWAVGVTQLCGWFRGPFVGQWSSCGTSSSFIARR
jgi:hypothetical protein